MGEADWWLCARCNSLNNLAARKCYSCRQRKPKDAVRASQRLGYVPVESWDGKITLKQRTVDDRLPPTSGVDPLPVTSEQLPPPLREPVPRDTLVVAPRPPHPARITYRHEEPPAPMYGPATQRAGMVKPPSGPWPGPVAAVGPGPPAAPGSGGELWPHWHDLLDTPTPQARRLRLSQDGEGDLPRADAEGSSPRSSLTLGNAIRQARGESLAPAFVPWPDSDRLRDEDRKAAEPAADVERASAAKDTTG